MLFFYLYVFKGFPESIVVKIYGFSQDLTTNTVGFQLFVSVKFIQSQIRVDFIVLFLVFLFAFHFSCPFYTFSTAIFIFQSTFCFFSPTGLVLLPVLLMFL